MRINFLHNSKWLRNYKIKLFSLLGAFIIWFYVVTNNNYDHTLDVSIRLINKPSGWILKQPIPSKVKVLFRGTGKDLISFRFREKHIDLDLHQKKGGITFLISPDDIVKGIPLGMSLTPLRIVEPETVRVELDRYAEKKVPVTSDITLISMRGYVQVGDVGFEPDSLVVSGPKSLLNDIIKISTEKKEYRNLVRDVKEKVDLSPPPWETVHYSIKNVKFHADIQRLGERVVKNIPIRVINVPRYIKNVKVMPSTLTLTVRGGVNLLSVLKKEDIQVTIDYRTQRFNIKNVKAAIKLPDDIDFTNAKPKFFELVVER
jgi:YbbR domain-containing protein